MPSNKTFKSCDSQKTWGTPRAASQTTFSILLADQIQDSIPAGRCTDTAHQPVHTRTGQIPIQTSRYSSERPLALITCRNNSFKTDTHSHKGRWSMYPTHHESVSSLLQEDDLYFDFHDVDRAAGCINEYDTNIMGKFICDNKTCGTDGWSSKRIAITIRMYPREEYNARVYHQRCDGCGNLSRPVLNETYAERIVYRIKKWNGIAGAKRAIAKPLHEGKLVRYTKLMFFPMSSLV
ncbi:conserved hypothetical protein [Histoplasma mississippiense (nom. inval.)]|uniref:conserved hypothetical protein n=1 Tax=Ajellomyces capsulatus (strain NAm1 / WU24) TaxID=2059318 RepID=UPI000157B892|nr:conserved hypothetical protein [Histoplasma mississippiense (nom. inval.)]EDN03960.1 conserved hypothetical protein [Histoplasma mississippiense (nom. inval.)]